MTESLASPLKLRVPVKGGAHTLVISPWTMEQHDDCFPIVVELVELWQAAQTEGNTISLGSMITQYKDQVTLLCKLTVREQLKEMELSWDKDLWAEDLFGIGQAIWQTSLLRPGGEGVLGKALALMGPLLVQLAKKSDPTPPPDPLQNPSQSQTSKNSPPPDSPSLPVDGDLPPPGSVVN